MAFILGCALGLACGVLWGIYDCKRTFDIPAHAKPLDGRWYSYDDIYDMCDKCPTHYGEVDDYGLDNP